MAALGMRPARLAAAVVTAGLLLGGCGSQESGEGAVVAADRAAAERDSSTGVVRDVTSAAPAPSKAPSLPPGDPGLDAPAAPDPGTASADPHGHDEAAKRKIPAAAMLTAETVRMAMGGTWSRRTGGADECMRPEGALGARSMSYGGSPGTLVVETVSTYRGAKAADEAVADLGGAAAECGWTVEGDPRLGSASVAAKDQGRSMVAVSAEGVVVLLVGSGDVTRPAWRWSSLVDLALGTSCPAAPDGCH